MRLLLYIALATSATLAQDCPRDPNPTAAPSWKPIRAATHVAIVAGAERVTPKAPISRNPTLPFPGHQGAMSQSRYPSGPPWPFNASASSTCPEAPAGANCAGKRIFRNPGYYLETARMDAIRGFEFDGAFAGTLKSYKPGTSLVETVFFHENPVYFGGAEYGFYYEPIPAPRLVFYWSTNSNCGYQPAICRTGPEGGEPVYENGGPGQPPPMNRFHGCSVPLKTFANYRFQAWIDGPRFRVRVLDSAHRDATPPMLIDPNLTGGNWFPIQSLGAGYVTIGITRTDAGNSMVPDGPVQVVIGGLSVAVKPKTKGAAQGGPFRRGG